MSLLSYQKKDLQFFPAKIILMPMTCPPPPPSNSGDDAAEKDDDQSSVSIGTHEGDADATQILEKTAQTLREEYKKARDKGACLIMIRGPLQGNQFFINKQEMTIGRDPTADISVSDPSISRKHARVRALGDDIELIDLGSANGTVVNGNKIASKSSVNLQKEDMIRLGNTIFKYIPAGDVESLAWGHMDTQAHTDPLTRISNRRYLDTVLEAEFKRARTIHNDISVIYFDIDFFKKINDTYNHIAGDYVLREMASLIQSKFIHGKNVFARYGGEEFVIMLANTALEQAREIAEEIRSSVESHPFIYNGKRIPTTISLGVAELTASMDSPKSLLKAADKALFESKSAGRNQVTTAS